jgi:O-antigen biosynthesis protein
VFAKVLRHMREHGARSLLAKLRSRGPAYLSEITHWQWRRCECCQRPSLFLANGFGPEFSSCLFCGANQRYELLATELRTRFGPRLRGLKVLELDPRSPLRPILAVSAEYRRSFYSDSYPLGKTRKDGARCEDITRLTFSDSSLDLIVSSDVLEHVPDLQRAFAESARVLVPGGVHLFTVPTRGATRPRAVLRDGKICHLSEPEYHQDPLSEHGILAFWDIGPDLPAFSASADLEIKPALGPVAPDNRIVWAATRKVSLVSTADA